MKKIFLILIVVVLFSGCSSSKKLTTEIREGRYNVSSSLGKDGYVTLLDTENHGISHNPMTVKSEILSKYINRHNLIKKTIDLKLELTIEGINNLKDVKILTDLKGFEN